MTRRPISPQPISTHRLDRSAERLIAHRLMAAAAVDPADRPGGCHPSIRVFLERSGCGSNRFKAARVLRTLLSDLGSGCYLTRFGSGPLFKAVIHGRSCSGSLDQVIEQVGLLLPAHPFFCPLQR